MKQSKVLSPLFHLADFDRFPPSIENLNPALTVNGITVLPSFRYNGKDASASGWPAYGYGSTLNYDATGNVATFNNGSPLLGSSDDSVKFDGANNCRTFAGPNNDYANLGYNDLYFEALIKVVISTGATHCYLAKDSYHTQNFYRVVAIGNVLYFNIRQDDSIEMRGGYTYSGEQWVLLQAYYNNSIVGDLNALKVFSNGVLQTTEKSGSPQPNFNHTNTGKIRFGRQYDNWAARETPGNIGYAGMWFQPSWFSDVDFTELTTMAQTRFAQLIGTYPNQSRGTYLPSVATRNSTAYLEKIEENGTKKLYLVGTNWIRSNSTIDSNNKPLKGLLIEPSSTNLQTYSHDFSNNVTAVQCSIANTSVIGPDGNTYIVNTLKEDSVTNAHYFTRDNWVGFATLTQYVISLYVKAVNRTWITLGVSSSAVLRCFFNIGDGVVGTINGTAANKTSGIIPCGNGWFHIWVSAYGLNGTIPAIFISDGEGGLVFKGLEQDSLHIWGHQIEVGTYPSSYIPTTTAAVTRVADSLRYVATNNINPNKGSLIYDIYTPSYDIPSSSCPICISNAGSSTIQIASKIEPINDATCLNICNTSLQCSISGSTDIASGKIYTIKNSWNSDFAGLEVNQTPEGTDSSIISVPTGLNRIDLSDQSATNQFGGLIKNIKIYDDVLGKGKLK